MKKMWKTGACIALCSAMLLTNVGGALPANIVGVNTAYAVEVGNTVQKTFTAEQLALNWGNASHELKDRKWEITFKEQYNQVKWNLPESIELSSVESVTFKVEDQVGDITLKVYNGGTEAEDANTQYGLSGETEYTMNPTGEGTIDAVGIMTTAESDFGSVKLVSVTFKMKAANSTRLEYTAKELEKAHVGGAEGTSCELADGKWEVQLKHDNGNNQYPQAVWKLPQSVDLAKVESVTFNVADQNGAVALKLGMSNENGWYDDVAVAYGQNDADHYAITPSTTAGMFDRVVIMTTGSDASLSLISVVIDFKEITQQKPEIEKNISDWKDSVTGVLGDNSIAGGAIMASEITDDTLMDLVEKHFNAVTFGNELKPDALFDYKLTNAVSTAAITFNDKELLVPDVNGNGGKLNFSRADAMLEKILEWNKDNPEDKIRVRGHVLVWHSQTQEWFFHEDYDITKPYVDKDTMNRRLEWFISSVFDHYFGEEANHKYDGLFYGWDVVNEAVDGNGYRTDTVNLSEPLSEIRHGSNSSWWHVYQSNEFIINAFKYANEYAPKNVELYYNDYGETDNIKCEGILKLINDVKSAEGTRLDAFGMQAHYDVNGFSAAQFKTVAEKYAKAAGKVQLTELDFKASNSYDGSTAAKETEYTKMAYCHKQLFDAIKDLKKNGTNVSGITVWGVIEPNSWLHSQSNVGGGANGSKQCPLLFDGNYKAKPAYWAYVDATKLQPYIQKITVEEAKNGKVAGQSYCMEQDDTIAEIVPVWDKDGLTVQVTVTDATENDTDAVTVYADVANTAAEVTPQKETVKRSEAEKTENGYKATVKIPVTGLAVAKTVGMDVVVVNGKQRVNFNDKTGAQETNSKYYAKATMKPGVEEVPYGTAVIDGEKDASWNKAVTIPLTINLGSNVSANAKALWDKNNLYVYAEVKDPVLNKDATQAHEQDSLEVFIDENNGKTASYDEDDKQYRINFENKQSFNGKKCLAENVKSAAKITEDGYVIEAAFKWTDLVPENGKLVGLEFQINDADASGKRIGTLSWNDENGVGWSKSEVYGTVRLVGEESKPETKPGTDTGSSSNTGSSSVAGTTTKPETKPETSVEKNEDGSTTETSKVTVATSDGKEVETSVAVSKDADGNVTGANATVSAKKGEFSAEVIKQLAEAAGTESIAVTAEVKDAKGKVSYTVTADSKDLKAGATLKVVAIDKKTGKYELVNAKSYTVDKDGNISVSLPKGADYKLLSEKESAKVEKAIVKTIAVEKKSAAVKEGKSTKIKMSSKLNMDNVKKITYTTSKKSIATVNKNGKISAKKKGTVTVKATVTLKNGKKKTVSMKITVK